MLWCLSARLGETTDWHSHDVLEFVVCRSGSGQLEFDGRTIRLQPWRTVVIASGVRHRFVFAAAEAAELKILCLSTRDLAAQLSPAQLAWLEAQRTHPPAAADHGDSGLRIDDLLSHLPDGFTITDDGELRLAWSAVAMLLALHALAPSGDATRPPRAMRSRCARSRPGSTAASTRR